MQGDMGSNPWVEGPLEENHVISAHAWELHGQRTYRTSGCKEADMTQQLNKKTMGCI